MRQNASVTVDLPTVAKLSGVQSDTLALESDARNTANSVVFTRTVVTGYVWNIILLQQDIFVQWVR